VFHLFCGLGGVRTGERKYDGGDVLGGVLRVLHNLSGRTSAFKTADRLISAPYVLEGLGRLGGTAPRFRCGESRSTFTKETNDPFTSDPAYGSLLLPGFRSWVADSVSSLRGVLKSGALR
jgi:hypothetical protein